MRKGSTAMDYIDLQTLRLLKENARISASEISAHVKLSVSAVIERIRKLEQANIIKQYTIVVDHKNIGNDVTAFVTVSLEHPRYHDNFIEEINKNNQINECHYMTGDVDFILKIITKSINTLTENIDAIKSINGVSLTRTMVVLSTTKDDFTVIPDSV